MGLFGLPNLTDAVTDRAGFAVSDALQLTVAAPCALPDLSALLEARCVRGQIAPRGVCQSLHSVQRMA